MEELDIAVAAARAGARIALKYFHEGVEMRSNAQPYNLVSDADIEAEAAVVSVIRDRFPKHAVLAEETHRDEPASEHLWIIDPIDGTANFAHRFPYFSVSVAYYRGGRPWCSAVCDPVTGDLYSAAHGQGAFANGRPIRVAEGRRLNESLIACGFYYPRGALAKTTLDVIESLLASEIHGIRRTGSAALDLSHVASGRFGAFFELELAPWDFAAGQLIVTEAGGKVTDCRGGPLGVAPSSVLATNGTIHSAMLDILQKHLSY